MTAHTIGMGSMLLSSSSPSSSSAFFFRRLFFFLAARSGSGGTKMVSLRLDRTLAPSLGEDWRLDSVDRVTEREEDLLDQTCLRCLTRPYNFSLLDP